MVDKAAVALAVREVLAEMLREDAPAPSRRPAMPRFSSEEAAGPGRPMHQKRLPPFDPQELEWIKQATPARLAQGRTGTRYLTNVSITLRAEHAVALDAVHSEVSPEFAQKLGCIPLQSRAKDHEEFLLHPNLGRRLDDASKARLEKEGTKSPDVQVICGDGLSAWALIENGPELLPALQKALEQQGFKTGKPVFVKHCRIGVQDEIGTLLGARSTVVLVGERPGLGTGDSLSIYTAFAPKLEQDNAEKDCISNIRPLGIPPVEAAQECAVLMKRTFAAGGGGVILTRSGK